MYTIRSFQGYNKGKQAKEIPELYKGLNLLRLELKYKKRIRKYLGDITPWSIAEKERFEFITKEFREQYFSIGKKRIPLLDTSKVYTPKDIDNIIKVAGLRALGEDFFHLIEKKGVEGVISRPDRIKRAYRELYKDIRYSDPDALIRELDDKVNAYTTYV